MRKILYFALIATASGCLTHATAAEEFQDSIPIEVAEALFDFGAGGSLRVYSGLVEEFPNFDLPDGFEVLGSSDRSSGLTVALTTSLGEEEARAAITDSFVSEDWIELPGFGPPDLEYGFVSASQPPRPTYSQLCNDDYGQMSVRFRERESRNIVTLQTGNAFGGNNRTCAQVIEQQQMSMTMRSQRGIGTYELMPLLIVPDEAKQGRMPFIRGSGMRSSGDSAETETGFTLEWELEEVYTHFAEQITKQAWILDNQSIGTLTALGIWTQPGENGGNNVLRLDVVSSEDDRYDLTLTVEGPGGRSGGAFFLGN